MIMMEDDFLNFLFIIKNVSILRRRSFWRTIQRLLFNFFWFVFWLVERMNFIFYLFECVLKKGRNRFLLMRLLLMRLSMLIQFLSHWSFFTMRGRSLPIFSYIIFDCLVLKNLILPLLFFCIELSLKICSQHLI